MNHILIDRFVQLISRYIGLSFREQDLAGLSKKLSDRINILKLSSPEEYYQLLAKGATQSYSYLEERESDSAGFFRRGKQREMSGAREWKELLALLTTGESYFFRDRGQVWLLKNLILPQIINQQRLMWYDGRIERPGLRLWSAGCSTGEEAYSLAILVRELIPDWEDWQIFILGTDINPEAIAKAKLGTYSDWSFRTISAKQKATYFTVEKGKWKIEEDLRRLVTFRYGNLVEEGFLKASDGIEDIDLILCRNVFVYFTAEAIALALDNFYKALRAGGYLITAHAELHGQKLDNFETLVLPQSVIYQRKATIWGEKNSTKRSPVAPLSPGALSSFNFTEKPPVSQTKAESVFSSKPNASQRSSPSKASFPSLSSPQSGSKISLSAAPIVPSSVVPATSEASKKNREHGINKNRNLADSGTESQGKDRVAPEVSPPLALERSELETNVKTLLDLAKTLFQKKAYPEAVAKAREAIKMHPSYLDAYCLIANIYANLGDYQQAEYYCKEAIKLNYRHLEPYYLLAKISEEKGDVEIAKSYLKRIIYLSPLSINAYLELASIYQKEGDTQRAKKMWLNALEIVRGLPDDLTLENDGEITASQLKVYLNQILASK
ncbi:MAG: tetratricopeptide repeat protein [Oscillatoria sp. SIO1A7]|nr:tetratricopeptide repeat protein [Oscillatoria sp. SIO1A7]